MKVNLFYKIVSAEESFSDHASLGILSLKDKDYYGSHIVYFTIWELQGLLRKSREIISLAYLMF